MKLLCVIDMQNDFIDGVLGSPEAQAIVPKVVEKINSMDNGIIILTKDTHYNDYLKTEEGKHLPIPHCIIGTDGWGLNLRVLAAVYRSRKRKNLTGLINKPTFGYTWSNEYFIEKFYNFNPSDITEVEIVGLDTDFCVLANAMTLKAAFPNIPITIDAACCAGSTPEWHEKALDILEHCHFNIINRKRERKE
ncbi:MAG TPA: cysteine hydrolase [Methanosphaera sp.]|nr:cysteine hydrolase [Methanosphaera sp.]